MEKLCLGGVDLIQESKRFSAVQSIDCRRYCWCPTQISFSGWYLFPTVAMNVGFSWHSCSPLQWRAPSPREPLCSGGYLYTLLRVAYDQGLALSCTKDWLPDVEVGLTPCCSTSSHAMRLKLDILAWLLPLCYFASFFLPSSFWELSFNKVFARESLLLGNSK